MKKVFLTLIALLFVGLASVFAQTVNESIAVEKNKYYYHGLQIESMRQIKSIVANDELALKEVKKAGVAGGSEAVRNAHTPKSDPRLCVASANIFRCIILGNFSHF